MYIKKNYQKDSQSLDSVTYLTNFLSFPVGYHRKKSICKMNRMDTLSANKISQTKD